MICLYIFCLLLFGITIFQLFSKKMNLKKLNIYEKISLVMGLGCFSFIIYMFIIGILPIKYSFYIFLPLLGNAIYQICYGVYILITKKIKITTILKELKKTRKINIILMGLVLIWIIYYAIAAISTKSFYPDEYSVWLLNAKNIFLGKNLNLFMNTGLEIYPPALSFLYSGFYFFVDRIEDNSVRIFSSFFFLMMTFGLIGYAQRNKLKISYLLIAILLILISYAGIDGIMSSSYGDIAFMSTYTLGMIYLGDWLIMSRKKETLFLAIIMTMMYSLIKTEAVYLLCYNILLLIICNFFHQKLRIPRIQTKTILGYSIAILLLPICWKIYTVLSNFPGRVLLGAKEGIQLNYIVPLFTSMTKQLFECWPWVIAICICCSCIGIYIKKITFKEKELIFFHLLIILVNIAFLILSYMFVFGAEALTAASFIRYMTRVMFIMITIMLISLKHFRFDEEIRLVKIDAKEER